MEKIAKDTIKEQLGSVIKKLLLVIVFIFRFKMYFQMFEIQTKGLDDTILEYISGMFNDMKIVDDEEERNAVVIPLLLSLDSPKLKTEQQAQVWNKKKQILILAAIGFLIFFCFSIRSKKNLSKIGPLWKNYRENKISNG